MSKLVDAIERLHWVKPAYFRFSRSRRVNHMRISRPSMLVTDTYLDIPLAELTSPEVMKNTEEFWIERYNWLLGMQSFFRQGLEAFSTVVENLTAEMNLNTRQRTRFFPISKVKGMDDIPIYLSFVLQGMMLSGFTVKELSPDSFTLQLGNETFGIDKRKVIGAGIDLGPFDYRAAVSGGFWAASYTKHVGAINALRNSSGARDKVAVELIKGAIWNLTPHYINRLFPEDVM